MGFYIDSSGGYYEGDQQGSDKAVPQRPSPNHTFDGEKWGLALPRAQSLQWEAIKQERDRRKAGGVKVGSKWFHSDDSSRIQQMGLVMMGANIPAGLLWKTMDGTFIVMTTELAQQVFTAVATNDQTVFAAAEAHRVAIEASLSPLEYDFSANWPKTFGE